MFQSLRSNVIQLFQQPKAIPSVSSLANLGVNKQFVLALDAPGVPSDLLSFPLSWSACNKIAVACGCDVYYQDLDTREITHLCSTDPLIRVIEWAKQDSNVLALGAERGTLNLWDATDSTLVRDWSDDKRIGVYSFSWHEEVLAVGERPGSIGLYDVRVPQAIAKLGGHKVPVYALEWSPDGKYLASGDASGVVQIWDAAASKSLGEGNKKGGRMKHGALVKVILSLSAPQNLCLVSISGARMVSVETRALGYRNSLARRQDSYLEHIGNDRQVHFTDPHDSRAYSNHFTTLVAPLQRTLEHSW
jgi:cell division cycle protein 20 (cofactor of APC complex)